MNRAMMAAASGMAAQQLNLDVIADNLANADVAGFKGSVATFAPLGTPGSGVGGTSDTGTRPVFEQGKLVRSGGPFDVAIDGAGFFDVEKRGALAYTRAGSFARATDGSLRNSDGWRLRGVRVPADAVSLDVRPDGVVNATFPGGAARSIGRIGVTRFAAPEALRASGPALYAATPQAGRPERVRPGTDAGPKLAFGMLERSNVSIVESMMQILSAQRAYEANAKGVQAADEMLRIANNIHRA